MQRNLLYPLMLIFFAMLLLQSCKKNYTTYYADAENEGLAIFSNTGNNLMTCYVDGKPWRTINRTGFNNTQPTTYEVEMVKRVTAGARDTLSIRWEGRYNTEDYPLATITLVLSVPKNFDYRSLSSFNGQRIAIDTAVNGFFSTSISALSLGNPKGNGSIYFHTMRLDSVSPSRFSGYMSGLFEAHFPLFNITKGRFDSGLDDGNVGL